MSKSSVYPNRDVPFFLTRCGDEIVAVNGVSAVGMSNAQLIPMLKELRNKVTLTVVSWPGSHV